MSEFFGSVWWLLVTLGLLITFHEFGHFVVARRCGVKVLKFSIGFGRGLWSRPRHFKEPATRDRDVAQARTLVRLNAHSGTQRTTATIGPHHHGR